MLRRGDDILLFFSCSNNSGMANLQTEPCFMLSSA